MTLPRTCPKCGKKNLTEDDFPKRSDGRPRRECKTCYNQHRKQYRAKKEKRCSHCLQWKSVSEFTKDSTRADGYYTRCKTCEAERYAMKDNDRVAIITALHANVGFTCPKCNDELILDDDRQSVWCRKCGFRHYQPLESVDLEAKKAECRRLNQPNQYNIIGKMICTRCGKPFEGTNTRTFCPDCSHIRKPKVKQLQEVAI